ncbi:NAD(P)/FAD-dependent oxidoreductase [Sphingosinicella sp. LHD-64]|uniref:NAD(P)/FAD-dependent oxidoreductase n=1 Tax=Sphingosinicella sp. LHD-64 TaxID=3072139 RepID=UPI00280E1FC2|nr:NAD(P)/FAD-dependent oxidoreductase [Sphingosinicella sp. LHD-64]MDQ8756467.1 NAD(P)/FAD-dependent oxidoreductase [Sphingosinicella sp. LHD-64]
MHVVIVGAGFGGLACAKALGLRPLRVTVVDRVNYHLFVPLLYQVATAALSPSDIAEPIRRILRRYENVEVRLGEVTGVDWQAKRVLLGEGPALDYDRLVIATGSVYNYFGHDEWARYAPGLRNLENARAVRAQVLRALEEAEAGADADRRRALMTTIVVGGGPTGVETAGAVAELTRHALARDFRRIDPQEARVVLVEAGPRLLPAFPPHLGAYAEARLAKLGVEVLLDRAVEHVGPDGVTVSGERIGASAVIWGAGIRAAPAAEWLGLSGDRLGRIAVTPDLSVPERPGVYVIGDMALLAGADGAPLPALAQVAKQQGIYLGTALAREVARGEAPAPFRFHNRGNTAIIGRSAAVFDFGRYQLTGRLAWLLWAFVHVYLLVGFQKRVLVSIQWLWRYLTYERGARLIMDPVPAMPPPAPSRGSRARGPAPASGRRSRR